MTPGPTSVSKYRPPNVIPLPPAGTLTVGYHCEDIQQSVSTIPYIAPSLSCEEISTIPAYFVEYENAYAAFIEDNILQEKLDSYRPLTVTERQKITRLQKAGTELIQLGINLFKAAFLSNSPSEKDLERWAEFESKVKIMPHSVRELNILVELADSKLRREDRELLFTYVTSKSEEILPELERRSQEHYQKTTLNFNGGQGGEYYTESDVFMGVLTEYLGPYEFEKFQHIVISQHPQNFILEMSAAEAEELLKMPEDNFWGLYDETLKEFDETPPGTLQKIMLYRRINNLNAIALARGLSPLDHSYTELTRSIPGLTNKEYGWLFELNFYARYANGNQISIYSTAFINAFTYFATAYLEAPAHLKSAYSMALHQLDTLAIEFGFSPRELDELLDSICKKVHCSLSGVDIVEDLQKLENSGTIFEVSPEGLPREVKEILQSTGYWELVSRNLRLISLTPEINEGDGISSRDASGSAVPILRRVEIDYVDHDGKTIPAWTMAAILVHEAAHVEWRKEDILLQQSTPNERHAFATELSFLSDFKSFFGYQLNPEELRFLDLGIESASAAVTTANLILGYDPKDMSPGNKTIPDITYCWHLGLAGPEELDLSYYPTNPPPSFLASYSDFEDLTKYLLLDNPETIHFLWEVLEGRATLEVNTVMEGEKNAGIPTVFMVKDGQRIKLNEEQLNSLAQFFNTLMAALNPKLKIDEPYQALITLGTQSQKNLPNISKEKLASLLETAAETDYGKLQKVVVQSGVNYNVNSARLFAEKNLPIFLSNIKNILKKTNLSETRSLEILFASFTIAREIVNNPSAFSYYKHLATSEHLQKSDHDTINMALQIFRSLSKITHNHDEMLGLLDFTAALIEENLKEEKFEVTSRYSAANLRGLLYQTALSTGTLSSLAYRNLEKR